MCCGLRRLLGSRAALWRRGCEALREPWGALRGGGVDAGCGAALLRRGPSQRDGKEGFEWRGFLCLPPTLRRVGVASLRWPRVRKCIVRRGGDALLAAASHDRRETCGKSAVLSIFHPALIESGPAPVGGALERWGLLLRGIAPHAGAKHRFG